MLRVAILAPIPQEYEKATSGVPRACLSLARSLKKYCSDVQVTFVVLDNSIKETKYAQTDFCEICFLPTFNNRIVFLYLPDIIRVNRFLKQLKPDVVHSQGFPEYILAGEFSKLPHVATIHGIIIKEAKTEFRPIKHFIRALIRGFLEQLYVRRLKELISISAYVTKYVSRISSAHIHAIDNAIDEHFFEIDTAVVPGLILQVGSIVPRKGAHLLIEAVGRMPKTKVLPQVHIVGSIVDKGYFELLSKMILDSRLQERCFFHDSVSDAELNEFYGKADIVCLPSLEETSPLSIAQAMAAGKMIVASDCGGIPDLVKNGETGLLFSTGSSNHLGRILEDVLNGKYVVDKFRRDARNEAVGRFHPKVVAMKTREVYYSISSSSK